MQERGEIAGAWRNCRSVAKLGSRERPLRRSAVHAKPMVNRNFVGAIHESPEHGWILHKPNGGAQHVGAGLRARPRKRKIHTNPTERHRGRSLRL